MIFKRRDKQTWGQWLRDLVIPKKGWRRGIEYMGHRVKRIPDTPHKIALGAALGVFVCFTPMFGLHMLLAVVLAYVFRGNILAAFIATWVGNPASFPVIAAAALQLGRLLTGHSAHNHDPEPGTVMLAFEHALQSLRNIVKSWFGFGEASTEGLREFLTEVFLPYMLGGIILGSIAATLTYFLSRPAIAVYQKRRRHKMAKRRALHATRKSEADTTPKAD